jgi:hypothetical protein
MKKRYLVISVLLACLLIGAGAFAETASFRLGAGAVGSKATFEDDRVSTALGYELTGKLWFEQLPQLTVTGAYSSQDGKGKIGDTELDLGTLTSFSLDAEYRVYNETNYGFALNAGWLNSGVTAPTEDAEREASNFLSVGGSGNYVLTEGLQAVAGANYVFNNLTKKDDEEEDVAAINTKLGLEYEFAQVPGLQAGAYFTAAKSATDDEEPVQYGFNLGASYALSF